MLVYGDAVRTEDTREKIAGIADALEQVARMRAGVGRHGALVAVFVDAGELAQGIADADFHDRRQDARSPAHDAAMALLMQLAQAIWTSWDSGFASRTAPSRHGLGALTAAPLPAFITTRRAEGFAFYALYPECYASAALAWQLRTRPHVIGIRSIGAPLSAMVAAALRAPAPVTIRPTGHSFRREVSLAEELAAQLLAARSVHFAVVDEGPGLSGSSFGAIADYLEDRGVPADRIAFFPSHGGALGPQACERHRSRWGKVARQVMPFEALVLCARRPEHRLEAWVADVLGPTEGPPEDISGGRWRLHQYAREADWPPVHAQHERRKFLLRARGETWLLKFAGLGREGERKLERARILHAAGFGPPVAGYRHGFLIERWLDDARPLDRCPLDPDWLGEQVGRYLGFRARAFPTRVRRGASPAELCAMARHNAEEALGPDVARSFDRWTAEDLAQLAERVRPVETDNRLHAWEWLVRSDGRLLKCDALDHHAGHDLVGCQDIAWDVVGATVELELPASAQARLCAVVERAAGRALDPQLIALLTPCYLAFQLGSWTMAARAAPGPEEAARLWRAAGRYATRLRHALLAREVDEVKRRRPGVLQTGQHRPLLPAAGRAGPACRSSSMMAGARFRRRCQLRGT
jgi:hypothetical protein